MSQDDRAEPVEPSAVTEIDLDPPKLPPPPDPFFDATTPVVPMFSDVQEAKILETIEASADKTRRFMADMMLALRSDIGKELEVATALLSGEIAGTRTELLERIAKAQGSIESQLSPIKADTDQICRGMNLLANGVDETLALAKSAIRESARAHERIDEINSEPIHELASNGNGSGGE